MLAYLEELMQGEDAFLVSFRVASNGYGSMSYTRCGVVRVDAVGLVVERGGQHVAVPWTSVDALMVEVV